MTDTPLPYSTDTRSSKPEQPVDKRNPRNIASILTNPLFLMLMLFGLPYVLAWYFLYSGDPVTFEKPNNNGELISPMVSFGEFSLPLENGTSLDNTALAGNWSLVTVTSSCQQACQETLFTIRQIRKAMGVNRQVIKPIVLLQNPSALEPTKINFETEFPQLAVVSGQNDSTEEFIKNFSKVTPKIENSIFMLDPYGNLMMVYPAGSDQKGMLDDLKRLLKVNKPKL